MRQAFAFFVLLTLIVGVAPAHALIITETFSGSSNNGTGSGLLTFDDHGGSSTLTIRIDNTSPNQLDSGGGQNSSIITGIGFSVTPNLPAILHWAAVAGNGIDLTSQWNLAFDQGFGGSGGGISVEDLLSTDTGIHGGIYNAASPGNTNEAYPDLAVVTISFAAPFTLQQIDLATMRMQRVGNNGSLKLLGIAAQQYSAPEPTTFLIVLTGLLIITIYRKRKSIA